VPSDTLIAEFRRARTDGSLVVLEGFHAVKHGIRFGARIERLIVVDNVAVSDLAAQLAPDVQGQLASQAILVSKIVMKACIPSGVHTGVAALAARPIYEPSTILPRSGHPVVLLDDPRNLGNVGAVIRVAAAADARGVLLIGPLDPWNSVVIRGSAGLNFALPVASLPANAPYPRNLVACDASGEDISTAVLPNDCVFAFGSERAGLSAELLSKADFRVSLPMRPGVSSLNLATSVSAVLYVHKFRSYASDAILQGGYND
jgi:RNA methyltransferase, TrmH family